MACGAALGFVLVSHAAGKSGPEEGLGIAHLAAVWTGFVVLAWLLQAGLLSPPRFWMLAAALACLDGVGALYVSQLTISSDPAPWYQQPNRNHKAAMDLTASGLGRSVLPPESLGIAISNRNLLIKLPVLGDYISLGVLRNRFLSQVVADPQLNRIATGTRRFWFSAVADWQVPDDASFRLWARRMYGAPASAGSGGQPVVFLHSPEQMLALAPQDVTQAAPQDPPDSPQAGLAIPASITGLIYQPDLLSFRYDAPSPGYLLVTDRWAPGWEVSVNGQSRPVLAGDFLFRAVQVDAGSNLIRFVYNPPGFLSLLALSWFTLILAAAWVLRTALRSGRLARRI